VGEHNFNYYYYYYYYYYCSTELPQAALLLYRLGTKIHAHLQTEPTKSNCYFSVQ